MKSFKRCLALVLFMGFLGSQLFAQAPAGQPQQQDTGTFIEDKLFKIVADAYDRRDEQEFLRLHDFFLTSFPNSQKRAQLDAFRNKFFYSEALDIFKLGGALVEVTNPPAKTWEELSEFFKQLKQKGMKRVQVQVYQSLGKPVYLFVKPNSPQGYFFKNPNGAVVEDILDKMADLVHDNEMQLYASLPIKNQLFLDRLPFLMIDSSYNPTTHDLKLNGKLDLLHPEAGDLLFNLVEALSKTKVDGVIIEDDFTLNPTEGFSPNAIRRFKLDTGIELDLNNLLVAYQAKGDWGVAGKEEWEVFLKWRSHQIKQLLFELVDRSKKLRKEFLVGAEVTPEMLGSDPLVSRRWYSTSFDLLWDLDVDFYILKWRKQGSIGESSAETYLSALTRLRQKFDQTKNIYLKIPLSEETQNVIKLNDYINLHLGWMEDQKGLMHAIGPIDRQRDFDFLQHRVVEKLQVETK